MPRISVCIPAYAKPPTVVQRSLDSVGDDLAADMEILVVPDGEATTRRLAGLRLPGNARLIATTERRGLAGNWNRCVELASGELIHLLHDDDELRPGFYRAVLALDRAFPDAGLLVVASRDGPLSRGDSLTYTAQHITGDDAAAFLLDGAKHCCGSVVLKRSIVDVAGPFSSTYPYCPDEEAYLRYAARGGLAFDPSVLYEESTHDAQARLSTWTRTDFVATYFAARTSGAAQFGAPVRALARRSSARRVISTAVTLGVSGDVDSALERMHDLARVHPRTTVSPRYWMALLACRHPTFTRIAAVRRRLRTRAG